MNGSKEEQLKAISMIKAAWPKMTEEQGILYSEMLKDIPSPLLWKSVEALIKESIFLPSIAEIRERARSLYSTAKGIKAPHAAEEWKKVLSAISSIGSYGKCTGQ